MERGPHAFAVLIQGSLVTLDENTGFYIGERGVYPVYPRRRKAACAGIDSLPPGSTRRLAGWRLALYILNRVISRRPRSAGAVVGRARSP